MTQFRACKLQYNGSQYIVNKHKVVMRRIKDASGLHVDGFNEYTFVDQPEADAVIAEVNRLRANKARRTRDQIRRDLGLVKVRGALGGIYWE